MKLKIPMVIGLVLACCGAAAQQPADRIDLDRFAEAEIAFVGIRAAFEDSPAVCPEDHGLLRISDGVLRQLRHSLSQRSPARWRAQNSVIDNATYLHQYGTDDCRFDLHVAMQVFRDGSWVPLLLPEMRRPNLSADERKRALDEFVESARKRAENMSPEERKVRVERFTEVQRTGWSIGRARTLTWGFGFDEAPPNCFQAVGEFDLDRNGLTLAFATNLPGDLNRFAIERSDVDNHQARFYLVRDDCRFELRISKLLRRGEEWVAVPLAATPPPRGQPPGTGRSHSE
jgi:hypothetical protein